MTIDGQLSILAGAAYNAAPVGVCIDYQDVRAVLTEDADGVLTVACRGTRIDSLADWCRDAEAVPIINPMHEELGPCHAGFLTGALGLWFQMIGRLAGRRVRVTGHSLGGALALALAALMIEAGMPPELVVTFEAPRVGGWKLRAMFHMHEVRQYRFGNDPVPEVPWLFGLYTHVREPLTKIGYDKLDPFACHEIAPIIALLNLVVITATAL